MQEPLELKECKKIDELLKQLITWGIRNKFSQQVRDFTEEEMIMMNNHLPKKFHTLTSGHIFFNNTNPDNTADFDNINVLDISRAMILDSKSEGEIQLCSISGNPKWYFWVTDGDIHIK